jgi:leucyl aminopeptidase
MFKSVKVGGRGSANVRVFGIFKGQQLDAVSRKRDGGELAAEVAKRSEVTGALGQVAEASSTGGGSRKAQRIIVVGLGEKGTFEVGRLRNAAAAVGRRIASWGNTSLAIELDAALSNLKTDLALAGRAFGEGMGLLAYNNDILRGTATDVPTRSALTLQSSSKPFTGGMELGLELAACTNYARTLSQLPPNTCTPAYLASEAKRLAKHTGMSCKVVSGDDLLDEGCIGIHTVGAASDHTPCLIRLEYSPPGARRAKPAVLVGKTMTYDSGGL